MQVVLVHFVCSFYLNFNYLPNVNLGLEFLFFPYGKIIALVNRKFLILFNMNNEILNKNQF